jgi:hypothetical protein
MLIFMSLHQIRSIACLCTAAAMAWGAFEHRAAPLISAVLALLCGGLAALVWRAGKGKKDTLHDPAISTLVFPPESKFEASALPRR